MIKITIRWNQPRCNYSDASPVLSCAQGAASKESKETTLQGTWKPLVMA
jgi:hypothetical protein